MPGEFLYPAGHFAIAVRLEGKVPLTPPPPGWFKVDVLQVM